MAEISMEQQTVIVSERLTGEAVACRLAAYPPADPLFYVPSLGDYEASSSAPTPQFVPTSFNSSSYGPPLQIHRINPAVVQQEGDGSTNVERAKNIILSEMLRTLEGKTTETETTSKRFSVDDFSTILASNEKSTHPLYLDTASQLGLMNDRAIPSIVKNLLPTRPPKATERFLKRMLLIPPPPAVGESMATLVSYLRQDGGPSLPPLSVPPLGKTLYMVKSGQANAQVYSELLSVMHSVTLFLELIAEEEEVGKALMTFLAYESGLSTNTTSLKGRCHDAIKLIKGVLCHTRHSPESSADLAASPFGDEFLKNFFDRNEQAWRGRVRREAAPGAYDDVEAAAQKLAEAVDQDFCGEKAKYDIKNNIVYVIETNQTKQKRLSNGGSFISAIDRLGKKMDNKVTTERVQSAIRDYYEANEYACRAVSDALLKLSDSLNNGGHMPAIVQASHANLILSTAILHAKKANSLKWGRAEVVDYSSNEPSAGHFKNVWPYWMARSNAVANTFDLKGM